MVIEYSFVCLNLYIACSLPAYKIQKMSIDYPALEI